MSSSADIIAGFLIILVGLPLFILWLRDDIRRASKMQVSKAQKAGQVSAYILGIFFIIIGVLNLGTDLERKIASTHPITSYVFDAVFTLFGLFTWAATRFGYGGGFWSIIGAFLVGGAFAGTVSIVETQVRGGHYNSPISFYTRIVSCWVIGGIFLFIGHCRHSKKQHVLSDTKLNSKN